MGQEVVVFREDLMAKMVRNLVGVKPDLESANLKRYVRLISLSSNIVFSVGGGGITDTPE